MFGDQHEERVTVVTSHERIEGNLFYAGGMRLSDDVNSSLSKQIPFLKIKNPTIYCRQSGEKLTQAPFAMVARDKIVMVVSHRDKLAPNRLTDLHRTIDRTLMG